MDEQIPSEFAQISWRTERDANGPRLRLEDLRTGRVRFLDALELESLIWLPDERLDRILDPSFYLWRDGAPETQDKP